MKHCRGVSWWGPRMSCVDECRSQPVCDAGGGAQCNERRSRQVLTCQLCVLYGALFTWVQADGASMVFYARPGLAQATVSERAG